MAKIELRLAQSHSLKDKRRIAKSLTDRLHRRYKVAIAEVGLQEAHQRLLLGLACVSSQALQTEKIMDAAIRMIETGYEVEIVAIDEQEISL